VTRIALTLLVGAAACGKPAGKPRSTTTLVVRLTDKSTGRPVAGRVLLLDSAGAPLHIGGLDLYGQRQGGAACAIAPGVVGSWDGGVVVEAPGGVPGGLGT